MSSKTQTHIDLSHLDLQERDVIIRVLDRDDALNKIEQQRLRLLKDELKQIRMKALVGNNLDEPEGCSRCRKSFGGWFDKTSFICSRCHCEICARCCQLMSSGNWICVYCYKQIDMDSRSCRWFYANLPRDKQTQEIIRTADIIRLSIKFSMLQHSGKPGKKQDTVDHNSPPGTMAFNSKYPPATNRENHKFDDMNEGGSRVGSAASSSMPSIAITAVVAGNDKHSSEEETEDITEMFAAYSSGQKKAASQTNLNLLTPYSASKESLASCYSNAGEEHFGKIPVTGEIMFGIGYDYKASVFQVNIRQCRDLAPVDIKKHRSDPYVKTYLLPDKTKNGKRKTRIKKNSLNPVYDEVLKYHITKSELETRTLCVMVWSNDRFGRNDFLGEVNITLDYRTFDNPTPIWHKLQNRNMSSLSLLSYKGDLDICLKFVSPEHISGKKRNMEEKGELQVIVKEARNLTAVRANGFSDPFCKCYLLPDKSHSSKRKSQVIRRNCNPKWNHTIIFENVSWEELQERSLELTVWDHDRLTSNDFLGGVRLSLGTGKSHGKDVPWMDSKTEEVSVWQAMLDRPNCWIEGTLLLRSNMNERK